MTMEPKLLTRSQKSVTMSPDILRDPVLHAAWAYYVEDMSQSEVADRLGVSRASVHNYLRQARLDGLVRIAIDPGIVGRSELAQDLAEIANVPSVYLVPDGAADATERVTTAAGMWLVDLVGRDSVLGVSWGMTVRAVAERLPRAARPTMTVVQLLGSMANVGNTSSEACSVLIAQRLGAACVNLHVPAVLSDPALVEALLREHAIAGQLAALSRCDTALFSTGAVDESAHVLRAMVATPDELGHYRAEGACAVVGGRFFDRTGAVIQGPLDGRIIGIGIDDLKAIRKRIVVCPGPHRLEALLAVLRGGFATHLITDEITARRALDVLRTEDRPPPQPLSNHSVAAEDGA